MPVHDDVGGDYGYDCAHEAATMPSAPPARRRSVSPVTARPEIDQHGDLGYDQAHEV